MDLVECPNCLTQAFTRTLAEVQAEIQKFNTWFDDQSPEVQSHYSGRSDLQQYKECVRCGGSYRDFRKPTRALYPGVTVNPILMKEEV